MLRNLKYIAKRNGESQENSESMEIDGTTSKKTKNQKPPSELDQVKLTLWAVVEDHESNGLGLQVSAEGTTIGIQAF